MVGLIVIAHAPLGAALYECAQHVYGCEPDGCVVIDVLPDADTNAVLERARQAVHDVDRGDGVLVLVDSFGATPGNIATQLQQAGRVEVVAGVNFPMLMRVLCYRLSTPITDLPEKAVSGGCSGIMKIASISPQNQSPPFPHDPNDGPSNDGAARLQDQ